MLGHGFLRGQAVRYRPGTGTYGYEDSLASDGRVAGTVVGFTATRVRLRLMLSLGRIIVRAVDPGSLILER